MRSIFFQNVGPSFEIGYVPLPKMAFKALSADRRVFLLPSS